MQAHGVCITMSHCVKQEFCLHGKGWHNRDSNEQIGQRGGVVVEDM